MNCIKKQLYYIFPTDIKNVFDVALSDNDWNNCEEIRVYNNGYICVKINSISFVINDNFQLSLCVKYPYMVRKGIVDEIINNAVGLSEYAYNRCICEGYITIKGGHRIGLCGKTVIKNGTIFSYKEYYSVNIRISKHKIMYNQNFLKQLLCDNTISNLCVISPPGSGKTTLIREFTQYISENYMNKHICIVDERNEIYNDEVLNKPNVSVISDCPKTLAYEVIIRSMSPDIVVYDEIWGTKEIETINNTLKSGIKCIFTVHGTDLDRCLNIPDFNLLKPCVFVTIGSDTGKIKNVRRIQ